MADKTKNTLADRTFTVSDQLKFLGSTFYGGARSDYGQTRAWLGVDPDLGVLPDVQAQAYLDPVGGQQRDVSIGYGDLGRFTTGERKEFEGRTAFDRLSGRVGPIEGYYERSEGQQPFDTQTDLYGGTLNLGPFRLSGEKSKRTTDSISPERREFYTTPESEEIRKRVDLEGSYPVGTGILRGRVGREWSKLKFPQSIWEGGRGTYSPPHKTGANIEWGGRLNLPFKIPAEVLLQAQYNRRRGRKPEYRVEGGVRVPF